MAEKAGIVMATSVCVLCAGTFSSDNKSFINEGEKQFLDWVRTHLFISQTKCPNKKQIGMKLISMY